jgi:hypothetical protein
MPVPETEIYMHGKGRFVVTSKRLKERRLGPWRSLLANVLGVGADVGGGQNRENNLCINVRKRRRIRSDSLQNENVREVGKMAF